MSTDNQSPASSTAARPSSSSDATHRGGSTGSSLVVVQGFEDSSGADDIMDDMDFVPSFPNGANGSRSIEDLNESAASEWTPASPRAGAEGMDESQISIPEGPEDSTFEGSTCSGFDEVDLEEILEGGVKVEDFRNVPAESLLSNLAKQLVTMGHVVADLFHYIKSNRKELLNESKVDMNDLITTNDRLFRYSDSEFSDLSIQQGSLQHAMELVSEALKQDKKKISNCPDDVVAKHRAEVQTSTAKTLNYADELKSMFEVQLNLTDDKTKEEELIRPIALLGKVQSCVAEALTILKGIKPRVQATPQNQSEVPTSSDLYGFEVSSESSPRDDQVNQLPARAYDPSSFSPPSSTHSAEELEEAGSDVDLRQEETTSKDTPLPGEFGSAAQGNTGKSDSATRYDPAEWLETMPEVQEPPSQAATPPKEGLNQESHSMALESNIGGHVLATVQRPHIDLRFVSVEQDRWSVFRPGAIIPSYVSSISPESPGPIGLAAILPGTDSLERDELLHTEDDIHEGQPVWSEESNHHAVPMVPEDDRRLGLADDAIAPTKTVEHPPSRSEVNRGNFIFPTLFDRISGEYEPEEDKDEVPTENHPGEEATKNGHKDDLLEHIHDEVEHSPAPVQPVTEPGVDFAIDQHDPGVMVVDSSSNSYECGWIATPPEFEDGVTDSQIAAAPQVPEPSTRPKGIHKEETIPLVLFQPVNDTPEVLDLKDYDTSSLANNPTEPQSGNGEDTETIAAAATELGQTTADHDALVQSAIQNDGAAIPEAPEPPVDPHTRRQTTPARVSKVWFIGTSLALAGIFLIALDTYGQSIQPDPQLGELMVIPARPSGHSFKKGLYWSARKPLGYDLDPFVPSHCKKCAHATWREALDQHLMCGKKWVCPWTLFQQVTGVDTNLGFRAWLAYKLSEGPDAKLGWLARLLFRI